MTKVMILKIPIHTLLYFIKKLLVFSHLKKKVYPNYKSNLYF